jgi:hypothetical protein
MKLQAVPRVYASNFVAPILPGEPRVIVGDVESWDALKRWQPEYLKRVAGSREVLVREKAGTSRNIYQNMEQGGSIAFANYLDWVLEIAAMPEIMEIARNSETVENLTRAKNGNRFDTCYYLDVSLRKLSEVLLKDICIPAWYRDPPIDIIFWCGVLGTSSGLHSDVNPNCNVQVFGRKHFILFDPIESKRVYRIPRITHCQFDPNLPDFDRFPMAKSAKGMECTLNPGECLYIPVGWYHQVTVMSEWALNVNFFWPRPFMQSIATPALWRLLIRRLLARWLVRVQSGQTWPALVKRT